MSNPIHLFVVERHSEVLVMYGVPEALAYERIGIFPSRPLAEGFAKECSVIAPQRVVRIAEESINFYGMPEEQRRALFSAVRGVMGTVS